MNKLIDIYGTDNYLRFVPFMGIGTIKIVCQNIFIISVVKNYFTTGKMAKLNSRNFIGIELDEEYFKIAKQRIEETINWIK